MTDLLGEGYRLPSRRWREDAPRAAAVVGRPDDDATADTDDGVRGGTRSRGAHDPVAQPLRMATRAARHVPAIGTPCSPLRPIERGDPVDRGAHGREVAPLGMGEEPDLAHGRGRQVVLAHRGQARIASARDARQQRAAGTLDLGLHALGARGGRLARGRQPQRPVGPPRARLGRPRRAGASAACAKRWCHPPRAGAPPRGSCPSGWRPGGSAGRLRRGAASVQARPADPRLQAARARG